jgi:VRR-NUC domain-containing protein
LGGGIQTDEHCPTWHDDFPWLFDGSRGTLKPVYNTKSNLSNFSTYALMYLLRRDEGIESVTYFRLCAKGQSIDGRREALQNCLRRWMTDDAFERLRTAIRTAGITKQGFEGEPDLFCWNEASGNWFFAETKGQDKLTESQRCWFAVCKRTFPLVTIKVCRLRRLPGG